MKKLLFGIMAFCAIANAQKGGAEPTALPADKIISVKEKIVLQKTITEKVYLDTLGNFEMKDRIVPQHIETEQARVSSMVDASAGDTLLSINYFKGKEINRLIYVFQKDFCGIRPIVNKMDVK